MTATPHPWIALIRQLRDAALWITPEGAVRACNRPFLALIGLPADDAQEDVLRDRHYRELFQLEPLGAAGGADDLLSRILQGGDGAASSMGALLTPVQATPRLVDCTFSALTDGADAAAGCLLVVRALSDFQQLALSAIRKNEGMWLALLEHSHAAIYLKEAGGGFRYANRAFCAWAGLTPDALLGKLEHEVLPPQYAEIIRLSERDILQDGQARTTEETAPFATGKKVLVATRFQVPDNLGNRKLVCCISTDVTKVKEMEQALRDHERELAMVARFSVAGEMASGLAHELKQPLAAAMNFTQTAANLIADADADAPRATIQGALTDASDAIVLASDIINRLRAFVNKKPVLVQEVDLAVVVARAVRFVQHEFRQASIDVRQEIATRDPVVRADPVQLEQVLINLLKNALEAMNAGGAPDAGDPGRRVEISVRRVDVDGMPQGLSVQVADNGPGIPADAAERLFEPFYTTRTDGMGMGLKISRSIIESLGGEIFARNREPRGAVFGFVLPSR